MPTDDELVAATLAGDPESFGALVGRHAGIVHRAVHQRLPAGDGGIDHDDACQEAWLRAYIRLATYRPGTRFGVWVAAIATYYCIDLGRRRRAVSISPDLLPARRDHAPGPEALALRGELGERLVAAIGGLTATERGAVVACCCQGRDHADAGALLGVPAATVKGRLFHGRQKMMRALAGAV
jgi:RNA polymerase sigma-70 factor (ECF subfamily)